jgi:hypothetical protein
VFQFVKEHQIKKRYSNRILVSDPTQLWILKGKTLKDKGNKWQCNVNWLFENSNDGKLIYIRNEDSNKTLTLSVPTGYMCGEEIFEEGNSDQLWIQGNATIEGYFTLQSYGLKQFLRALDENRLILDSKLILFDEYFILMLFSLKTLSCLQV